jgi:hypothetical protein
MNETPAGGKRQAVRMARIDPRDVRTDDLGAWDDPGDAPRLRRDGLAPNGILFLCGVLESR